MILVINRSKKEGRRLADSFHYMGVLSYAVTPAESFGEISTLYRTVVLMHPERLPDERDFLRRLNSYLSGLPIYAISDSAELKGEYRAVFKTSAYSAVLFGRIARELLDDAPGIYKLAGIDASHDLCTTEYFGKALPLTKTENMILRTLIKTYPLRMNAKRILKYAFKTTRVPEPSNIRTHVSVMNKKFREITGRNLITSVPGEGYRILTPELAELN